VKVVPIIQDWFGTLMAPRADGVCSLTPPTSRSNHQGSHELPMPAGADQRYDFFLSRRGSVATVAWEVADVLTYAVI
jgi:hypothetical protein